MRKMADVRTAVVLDDSFKKDVNVPAKSLYWRLGGMVIQEKSNGVLVDEKEPVDGRALDHTGWALSQFCTKMGMPTRYFERCPSALQTHNAEQWLHGIFGKTPISSEKVFLLRLRGATLRGFLSDRYTTLDNRQVLDVIEQLDKELGDPLVPSFFIEDRFFVMDVTFPKDELVKIGEVGTSAIRVVNSEVGAREVEVTYVLSTKDGKQVGIPTRYTPKAYHHRHIGITTEELLKAINEAIRDLPGVRRLLEFGIQKATGRTAQDADFHKIESALGEAWVTKVKEKLAGTIEWKVWDLVDALTDLAKIEGAEKRLEVEGLAGELLLS